MPWQSQLSISTVETRCNICGRPSAADELIELEGRSVCINCKPKVVQRIREGLPVSGIAAAPTQFLYISAPRLVLTSIGSLGIFEAYWIYKNWRYYKEKHDMAMRPFWRGIFGIFFIHSLFRAIRDDPDMRAVKPATFDASWLATGWVVLAIVNRVIDRIHVVPASIAMPLALVSVVFFVPVQRYINEVNEHSPTPLPYSPWSFGQILCLAIGLIIWALAGLGLVFEMLLA